MGVRKMNKYIDKIVRIIYNNSTKKGATFYVNFSNRIKK